MTYIRPLIVFLIPLAGITCDATVRLAEAQQVQQDRSRLGMVVSDSPAASRIGRDVLARGGNAVDAAVATAFALAVTWPEAGNIGGGGFMMVYPANGGEPICVEYREMAPGAATKTMFTPDDGTHTHKIVGVPGTVHGLWTAHQMFGDVPWKEVVMPAVRLADDGFDVDQHLAASMNKVMGDREVQTEATFQELKRTYGNPTGEPWKAGDRLVLNDLARSLLRIAQGGADAFYRGSLADQLVDEMQRGGGLITKDDLASYRAKTRKPVRGTFRGHEILGPPPPSSGGISAVEALNILENFDLRSSGRYSARTMHLIAEASRRAFCDRAKHLGDPDFVAIADHLTDKQYSRRLASEIDLNAATPSESLAPDILQLQESSETTHFSVIDSKGMAVSNTYTLEGSWGARIVVRGAGFLLNNEMGDFNWFPGKTDRQGRIGTEPNQIAPHKRMLSSQSPTIVLRDGRVVLVTGSPGGRTIINTVIQIVLNVVEFQMDPGNAVRSLRQHHQWFPDQLQVERLNQRLYGDSIQRLREMQHAVVDRTSQGSAHSIWVDPQTGEYVGVADWRRGGLAAGVP